MDVAEAMIKHIITTVMDKCPDEINFFNSFVDKGLKERLEHVAASDFGRVSYTEAVELLKKNNDKFDYKVDWGLSLIHILPLPGGEVVYSYAAFGSRGGFAVGWAGILMNTIVFCWVDLAAVSLLDELFPALGRTAVLYQVGEMSIRDRLLPV